MIITIIAILRLTYIFFFLQRLHYQLTGNWIKFLPLFEPSLPEAMAESNARKTTVARTSSPPRLYLL